jgi:phage-related protein
MVGLQILSTGLALSECRLGTVGNVSSSFSVDMIYKNLYSAFVAKEGQIAWEGDSKEVLSAFPVEVKATLGFSLRQLQKGNNPRCSHRPMPSIGKGVWELKESDERTWYRVMYLSKIGNVVYVLHCFEKDSRKTDRRDIEMARSRLQEVRQRLREQR